MSYDLSVQPADESPGLPRSSIESMIANIPGVRHYRSSGIFEYGQPPSCVLVFLDGESAVDTVSLSLPDRYNRKDTAALALLLAFKIADHLRWEVHNRQTTECYDPGVLRRVLKSQREFGETTDEILARRAGGAAPFSGVFFFYFLRPAPAVIVFALLLVAGAPGFFIYGLSLPVQAFLWLAVGAGLSVFGAGALVRSLIHARRTR